MREVILNLIRERLKNDARFDWQRRTESGLGDGVCPKCGERECYVSLDKPYRVACRRTNKCQYTATMKDLYPDLFENFTKLYPQTQETPNASADAYLLYDRHFDITKIAGWYEQGSARGVDGHYVPTVKFTLPNGVQWHRFIDKKDADENKKSRIYLNAKKEGYKGLGWVPPGMVFSKGDTVYITEGIFKSIAMFLAGKKSISGLSSNNLPIEIIKEHKGKKIRWGIALDNDESGIKFSAKFMRILQEIGEEAFVIFPPVGRDWDDLWRDGKLTDFMFRESAWRGQFLLAQSANEKAFLLYVKTKRLHHVFPFENALYKYKVEAKNQDSIDINGDGVSTDFMHDNSAKISEFMSCATVARISNCVPDFLYFERDKLTNELMYFFEVVFLRGGRDAFSISGDMLDSPSSFNKVLLKKARGGTFDGNTVDLKTLRDEWMNRPDPHEVMTIPFCGYDRDTGVYIFPKFAYHDGKQYVLNENDYFEIQKNRIKCGLKSAEYIKPEKPFVPFWFADFYNAFGNNGLVLLSWWLGTLFAEQIRKHTQSWPFLEYTGDQGAGKTTQLEFCWKLLGRSDYEGFDPNAGGTTKVGLARNFQQVANLPVILIEGDREKDKKTGFNYDELKKVYNGRGIRTIGTKKRGADTEEPPFRGAICISQNASITGSEAFLSRIIHCHVTREGFNESTRQSARRLETAEVDTLVPFLGSALSAESELLEIWKQKNDEMAKRFAVELSDVQERLIFNHAKVFAWAFALQKLIGKTVFTDEMLNKLYTHMIHRCRERQNVIKADHPLVERFWTLFEAYNTDTTSYGAEVEMLNISNKEEFIAINLPLCMESFAAHHQDKFDLIELQHLLPQCIKYEYVGQKKVKTRKGKVYHCWVFKRPKAKKYLTEE